MKQERPTCPVCGSPRALRFLERGLVPIHQNRLVASESAAKAAPRGELTMACCHACGFVFNTAFDPHAALYGEGYENTQSCSPYFRDYTAALVRYLVEERGLQDSTIVEVGCGNGDFLRSLVEFPGSRNVGYGFDPSYTGPAELCDGRLRLSPAYFSAESLEVTADAVICRHVIEHVPEPLVLLRSIKRAIQSSPTAYVFFETPSIDWILTNGVIWDFFYEHCSLFSESSLRTAFELAGFEIQRVHGVFENQYLWLECNTGRKDESPTFAPGATPALAGRFADEERAVLSQWKERLMVERALGKLAIWGAGAKGVTFASLVDPTQELVDCLVDLNPAKQGCFVPGTGHPIVGVEALDARGVRAAVVMNPNYVSENRELLRQAGLPVKLIEGPIQ